MARVKQTGRQPNLGLCSDQRNRDIQRAEQQENHQPNHQDNEQENEQENGDPRHGIVIKGSLYYFVEKIMKHKKTKRGLEYKIKWEGYDDPKDATWEPERHLGGSFQLLKDYKEEKGLGPPTVKILVGFRDENQECNEASWAELTSIVELINKERLCRNLSPQLPLDVVQDCLVTDADKLFIVPSCNHCYMGLYIRSTNTCYVADGSNDISTEAGFKEIQHCMENVRLRPLQFNQQRAIDYCGSSACSIALELARLYKTDSKFIIVEKAIEDHGQYELYIAKAMRLRYEQRLQGKAESKKKLLPRKDPKLNRCLLCNWYTIKSGNRSALTLHLRRVHGNKLNS